MRAPVQIGQIAFRIGENCKLIKVAVFLRSPLDRVAFAALFRQQVGFRVIGSPESVEETLAVCMKKPPDVAILDATRHDQRVVTLAKAILRDGFTRCVVLLGYEPDEAWDAEARMLPNTTFVSRADSFDHLMRHIELTCGIDPALAQSQEERTTQLAVVPINSPHFSMLSRREREMFCLLVAGNSVRQCAAILKIALPTADNHKSRLMKKLNVHKTVDLVRLAVREGILTSQSAGKADARPNGG